MKENIITAALVVIAVCGVVSVLQHDSRDFNHDKKVDIQDLSILAEEIRVAKENK